MMIFLPDSRSTAMKQVFLSIVLLMATLTGIAVAQEPLPDALRPGDAIRLQLVVSGDGGQDYSGEYMIDETGTLTLPLIETIRATSVPAQDLRRRIIQQYQSLFRNQAIQVTVLRRVSVLGAVRTPGLYHVDPTMRIGEVIASAGGITATGKQNEVRIIRNGQEIKTELTLASAIPRELRSGDQIIIPEKTWVSRNIPWLVGVGMTITAIIVRGYR